MAENWGRGQMLMETEMLEQIYHVRHASQEDSEDIPSLGNKEYVSEEEQHL